MKVAYRIQNKTVILCCVMDVEHGVFFTHLFFTPSTVSVIYLHMTRICYIRANNYRSYLIRQILLNPYVTMW